MWFVFTAKLVEVEIGDIVTISKKLVLSVMGHMQNM